MIDFWVILFPMPTAIDENTSNSMLIKLAFAIWMITLAIVLAGRILGPSDLGQNLDQSKTIAFTLDMVHNHQWIIPRDSLGELSRKPPLVNWVGSPIVALGFHSQIALKLPAILSGISITLMIFFIAKFFYRQLATSIADAGDRAIATNSTAFAMLAAAAWIASPSAIKHIYFMRPDILFAALLTGAWFASIKLLDPSQTKHIKSLASAIWFLTALALLTKGPLAIFIPVYLIAHILIITPKGSRKVAINKLQLWWGIPLMILPPALWFIAAYRLDPDHVRVALLGEELGSRVGDGGLSGILRALTRNPGFFVERFLPWCVFAIGAMIVPPSSKMRSHPMGPATLWVLVVILTTTLMGMDAGSYLMPAYPAAAILAVYGLFRLIATKHAKFTQTAITLIMLTVLVAASLITLRETTMSRGAKSGTGNHIIAFAKSASDIVNNNPVRFESMGDLPIASLMGLHQAGEIIQTPLHRYLIAPTDLYPDWTPTIISNAIVTHDPISGEPIDETIRIGLYSIPLP